MKRVIKIIIAVILVLGFHLTIRYGINELFINKYKGNKYDIKSLLLLKIINIPESYIVYFNEGNAYYQKNEYEKAILDYQKALESVNKKRVCDVRTNLALSKLALIQFDESNNNIRFELEEVQEVLLGNSCASEDHNGRDESSQKLYDQIEELLNSEGGGSGDPQEDPPEEQDPNEETNEEEIEEKIREQQEETSAEREEIYEGSDYTYSKDPTW
jgi:tetratricopeptide (TPR) repeat protein